MQKSKFNGEVIIIIALLIIMLAVGLIAYFMGQKTKKEVQEDKTTIAALTDSLHTSRNSEGKQVATIKAFENQKAKDFLTLQTNDATIKRLQEDVENYKKQIKHGGGVVVVSGSTDIHSTIPTQVIKPVNDSLPTYKFTFKDDWINILGVAKSSSTELKIGILDSYTIAFGHDHDGPFVEVTNDNPYSVTKTMRGFITKMPPPKKIGIGVQMGYGINGHGLSPYIGIGLSYNVIRF